MVARIHLNVHASLVRCTQGVPRVQRARMLCTCRACRHLPTSWKPGRMPQHEIVSVSLPRDHHTRIVELGPISADRGVRQADLSLHELSRVAWVHCVEGGGFVSAVASLRVVACIHRAPGHGAQPSRARPSRAQPSRARPSRARPSRARRSRARPCSTKPPPSSTSQTIFRGLVWAYMAGV